METRKLYYEDSHITAFCARVLDCRHTQKGWQVILDATAFYPEGGGQACDLGTLGGTRVLDVQEQGEAVVHLCDGALPVGRTVEGSVDWDRRFDLMQQHSGEHMVSGIIHKRWGYQNMGFHIGAELVTVDVAGPVPAEALTDIEAQTNAAVWQNLPVRSWYPPAEELPGLPYRSKKALTGPVRLVEFPGVDLCACCGTHVRYTGEIGLVKLISCVKFRNGVRIEMLSGRRAMEHLSRAYEQNRQVSQAFSAKLMETGEAARRMNEALAGEKYRTTGLQWQLFDHIAQGYSGRGNVVHFEKALSAAALRELAERIARACGGTAAVFSGAEGRYQLCLMHPGADVEALGSALNLALGAKGGGKPGLFQGSVTAEEEAIREFFQNRDAVFYVKLTQ